MHSVKDMSRVVLYRRLMIENHPGKLETAISRIFHAGKSHLESICLVAIFAM